MIGIDGHQDSYFLSLTREFRPGLVHRDGVFAHLFSCDGAGQPDILHCALQLRHVILIVQILRSLLFGICLVYRRASPNLSSPFLSFVIALLRELKIGSSVSYASICRVNSSSSNW